MLVRLFPQTLAARRVWQLRDRLRPYCRTMAAKAWTPNTYPPARRSDHVDTYKSASKGEVKVPDPYRWMEEYTEETDKWTTAQEAYTRAYIDEYPHRKRLEDAFLASQDYARAGAPILRDDKRWYWFHNTGLQPQDVMFRSKDSQLPDRSKGADNGEVFLDQNLLSDDGTASISTHAFSDSGEYYAYGISYSGSDFTTVYVRRTDSPLASKEQAANDNGRLPEVLKFVKFSSLKWTPDSKGFFYQRMPDRSKGEKVNGSGIETGGDRDAMLYYHRVNTPQSEDVLVYHNKDEPEWMYGIEITDDDKYAVLTVVADTSRKNLFWIAELKEDSIEKGFKWNKVVNEYEAEYEYVTNYGPVFVVRTNDKAPKYKAITIDISKGNERKDFVPETDGFLNSIDAVNKGENFVVSYKRNVKDEAYVYSKEGKELERLLPDFIGALTITARYRDSWFFINAVGFTTPGTLGRYDFTAPEGQRWSIYSQTKVKGLNPEEFSAEQVWYESKDGTKIPMFIVRHKSTPIDGTAPAIQYGYGGFSISINPSFSPTILTFLKTYGGVYAIANIRGGGEFGEEWHEGGYRDKKHNCFDDFIAATEYLHKNKIAAPGKVTINGGSNGGILVLTPLFARW
ncbi:prolyl oligopeptidase [Coprinopsis cinerea AmutBmut pab1-1]|nr:prolyl oligopeptidase [Coprinopsis cinerea AmutBmut pab1-1]